MKILIICAIVFSALDILCCIVSSIITKYEQKYVRAMLEKRS